MFSLARALVTLCMCALALPVGATVAAAATAETSTGYSVQKLTLLVRDAVYSPLTNRVYASVPARAATFPNTVVPIDPATGTTGKAIRVGTDPDRLALSDDGRYLYVVVDGRTALQRIDLSNNTVEPKFQLDTPPTGVALSVADMAVRPGRPDTVAVALRYTTTGPEHKGVSLGLYVNRQLLPDYLPVNVPDGESIGEVEFCGSADTVYAFGQVNTQHISGLQRFAVSTTGLTVTDAAPAIGVGRARCQAGLLYGKQFGRVMNPATGNLLGTYKPAKYPTAYAADPARPRVYGLWMNSDSTSRGKATLHVYDRGTYRHIEDHAVPDVVDEAHDLIMAGTDRMALMTREHMMSEGALYLLRRTQTASPAPAEPAAPVVTRAGPLTLRKLGFPVSDAVYSHATGKLLLAVAGSGGLYGNSVVPTDPLTGAFGSPIYVGSEPGNLALSADGRYLWVGLNGAASVRRVDLATGTVGPTYPLGRNERGWHFPERMAVVPGQPGTVAVSLSNSTGLTPNHEGVGLYADGKLLPDKTPRHIGPNSLQFCGADASTLYGYDVAGDSQDLYRMRVDTTGVTVIDVNRGVGGTEVDFECRGGLLYTTSGRVLDPRSRQLVGTYPGLDWITAQAVDPWRSLAYGLSYDDSEYAPRHLYTYRQSTFQLARKHRLPGIAGTPYNLLMAGREHLALVSRERGSLVGTAYLIDGLEQAAPGAAATPAWPAPTRVSGAVPAGRFAAFRVGVKARDIAYSPLSGKLYATVSGADGDRGNTILAVDPKTGAVETARYAGSQPNRLSLSRDGRYLWVGVDGAAALRRMDVVSGTLSAQLPLGRHTLSGWHFAEDLAAVPGSTDRVAVLRRNSMSVALYRPDGMLSKITPGGQYMIEFCDRPDELYGADDEWSSFEFFRMSVEDDGVVLKDAAWQVFEWYHFDIICQGRLIVSSHGQVIDPDLRKQIATYAGVPRGIAWNAFAPDLAAQRMYVVSDHDYEESTAAKLMVYNSSNYGLLDSYVIDGMPGRPQRLVRVDEDHMFVSVGGELYLLKRQTDGVLPTVAWSSPAANEAVRGTVSLSARATDEGGIARVEFLANGKLAGADTTPDTSGNYTISWDSRTAADGGVTIVARAIDTAVNATSVSRGITVDNAPPSALAPSHGLAANSTLGASTIPVKLAWSATDATSGVAKYQLQQRKYSGSAWSTWAWASQGTTARSLIRQLAPGRYQFQVRAQDKAGNWSAWKQGISFTLVGYQETSTTTAGKVSYTGTWSSQSVSSHYGGAARHSSIKGRAASFAFTGGKQVAWVAPKGVNRGYAYVYLDGVKVATVNLYASSAQYRKVVFAKGGLNPSVSHTLKVYVAGTKATGSTGTRVDVDGFVVLR